MKLEQAIAIANRAKAELEPFCKRIEIAGSIRRRRPEVKDIELVAIKNLLKLHHLVEVVNKWEKVKGDAIGKYTQRVLPEGIKLDMFFATEENWPVIYAIRTGSADFSHFKLAGTWARMGWKSDGGVLTHQKTGEKKTFKDESELFDFLGLGWISPELREV